MMTEAVSNEQEEANDNDDDGESPIDQALVAIPEENDPGSETPSENEAQEALIAGKGARDKLKDKKNSWKFAKFLGQEKRSGPCRNKDRDKRHKSGGGGGHSSGSGFFPSVEE